MRSSTLGPVLTTWPIGKGRSPAAAGAAFAGVVLGTGGLLGRGFGGCEGGFGGCCKGGAASTKAFCFFGGGWDGETGFLLGWGVGDLLRRPLELLGWGGVGDLLRRLLELVVVFSVSFNPLSSSSDSHSSSCS